VVDILHGFERPFEKANVALREESGGTPNDWFSLPGIRRMDDCGRPKQ
jgi:hypothetical protein